MVHPSQSVYNIFVREKDQLLIANVWLWVLLCYLVLTLKALIKMNIFDVVHLDIYIFLILLR